jgi:hypothetical protein
MRVSIFSDPAMIIRMWVHPRKRIMWEKTARSTPALADHPAQSLFPLWRTTSLLSREG